MPGFPSAAEVCAGAVACHLWQGLEALGMPAADIERLTWLQANAGKSLIGKKTAFLLGQMTLA